MVEHESTEVPSQRKSYSKLDIKPFYVAAFGRGTTITGKIPQKVEGYETEKGSESG
jgi:hypothetical protein